VSSGTVTSVVVTTALPGPLPVRTTVCGEPEALSATLSAAVVLPEAVGVKVIEIVQVAPAARVALQVLVCPNCVAPVPVSETAIPVMVAVPLLVSVTV